MNLKERRKVNTLIEKLTKPTFFHSMPGVRRLQTVIDFEQIVGQKIKITSEIINLDTDDLDGTIDGIKRRPIAVLSPKYEHSEHDNNIAHIVALQKRRVVNGIKEFEFIDSAGDGNPIFIRNQSVDKWKAELNDGQFRGFNLRFEALSGDKLQLNHDLFKTKPKN